MTVSYKEIIYQIEGPVATLTINRPETLNALTSRTQAEIRHALGVSENRSEVIGTVLTGAGKGFCSGVDMNALSTMSAAGKRIGESFEHLQCDPGNPDGDVEFKSTPAYFLGLRKPLIAAVNGACAGLGFSYATFCDMRFVASNAGFITSFSRRGLIAEHGTCWMLPRLVGPSNALDLFWSSRKLGAEEAFRIGYANRLCAEDDCVNAAQNYLKELEGTAAPMSMMMMKRQVYRHMSQELAMAMKETTTWMDESLARDDFKEGVASFVEKRAPNFQRVEV